MKTNSLQQAALLCLLCLLLTTTNSVAASVPGLQQQIPAAEYAALVDLASNIGRTYLGDKTWRDKVFNDPAAPFWYGVTVSGFQYDSGTSQISSLGHVTEIELSGTLLNGSIPASLGDLANLEKLDLSGNQLSGSIPASLGSLGNLQKLDLSGNQLSGSIPTGLGNLANLQELNLNDNQLNGSIPPDIGNLLNLQGLNLSNNALNGTIPDSFVNLTHLKQLNLSSNQLTGSIPDLSLIAPLTTLDIADNCFCIFPGSQAQRMIENLIRVGKTVNYQPNGCAPGLPGLKQQIPAAEYAALVDLYAGTQMKSGEPVPAWRVKDGWNDPSAPYWYGVTVSGFQYDCDSGQILGVGTVTGLDLNRNSLIGEIPDSLGNLVNLQTLDLQANQLSGSIPESLGNLLNLQTLDLDANYQLSGSIPESLGNLVNLQTLDLANNQLSGSIPASLGNLVNLQTLDLQGNQLSGSIPESLGNLLNLRELVLDYNHLSGNIPDSLGNLRNLGRLWLDDNKLSGIIPESLGNLVNLQSLYLESNQLGGSLPASLGNLVNCDIDISGNCFDISPGSQVRTVIDTLPQAGRWINYKPQNLGCGPVAFGDLNNDGCVDQGDLAILMTQIRARSKDLAYDLNGDGKVDVADARFLVLHFTNPGGSPCAP